MKKSELAKLIKEEISRYMFFENLKAIKQMVEEMLELDEQTVDQILSDGHDWAEDHIATSKDDVDEVYHFLMTKKVVTEKLKGKQVKLDANKNGKIDAEDFKLLKAKKK